MAKATEVAHTFEGVFLVSKDARLTNGCLLPTIDTHARTPRPIDVKPHTYARSVVLHAKGLRVSVCVCSYVRVDLCKEPVRLCVCVLTCALIYARNLCVSVCVFLRAR